MDKLLFGKRAAQMQPNREAMFAHMNTGIRHLSDVQLKAYFAQNPEQRAKVEKAIKTLDFDEEQDRRQETFSFAESEDQTHFKFSQKRAG
jgi:hypothetical protein